MGKVIMAAMFKVSVKETHELGHLSPISSFFGSLTNSGKRIKFHRDSKYIERVSINWYETR